MTKIAFVNETMTTINFNTQARTFIQFSTFLRSIFQKYWKICYFSISCVCASGDNFKNIFFFIIITIIAL